MKKLIGILTLIAVAVIYGERPSFGAEDPNLQNTISALEAPSTETTCYTSMKSAKGSRVLECNNPCCYKSNYTSDGTSLDKCKGSTFNNCGSSS